MTQSDKTAILYHSGDDPEPWRRAFQDCAREIEMRVYPDIGKSSDIVAALVWRPPPGLLASLPNLKLIHSKGAGIDHLSSDPDLPAGIPVVRLVDRSARLLMTQYVVHAALSHHRHMDHYGAAQAEGQWRQLAPPDTEKTTVAILGLGALGQDAARMFRALGFRVIGWSRGPKDIPDVECVHGAEALPSVLRQSQILVCLLALTDETRGIINARTLAALPQGAYVINPARGAHVVDDDLVAALDSGHIAGAALDVFHGEPLAPEHRFWSHPKVIVTPHISADALPRTAAEQVADNIHRALAGQPLLNPVDVGRGY
jgi:glyoxylate/hydroxypyruvate reductase A